MIQEAVIAAMQAGLGLPGGADELAALGVRRAVISALASLSPKQRNQLRGRVVWPDVIPLDVRQKASARLGALSEGMALL
jgi:hypothetical protein